MEPDILPSMNSGDELMHRLQAGGLSAMNIRRYFDTPDHARGALGRNPTARDLDTLSRAGFGWAGNGQGTPLPPSAPDPFSSEGIMKKLEEGWAEARKANETRYNTILGLMNNTGKTMMSEAYTQHNDANASNEEELISRGMRNSGVMEALKRGETTRFEKQKMDIHERIQGAKAGFMERRTDEYPQLDFYRDLILGKAGADAQRKGQQSAESVEFLKTIAGLWSTWGSSAFTQGQGGGRGGVSA